MNNKTALVMPDNSRKYFIAPHLGALPKGYTAHRAVFSLAQAPAEAFEAFFEECLATLPEGTSVASANVDRSSWGFIERWWALNMVIEYGGSVAIYASAASALAALKARKLARLEEVAS